VVAGDGTTTPLSELGVVSGSDENNDVVSGQLASSASTGAVVDVATGTVRWTAPGWTLGQFSTDGTYVAGQDAGGQFGIFDAVDGQRLASFQPFGSDVFVVEWAWDTDDTILAVATDGHETAIVRFDRNGQVTRATPVRTLTNRTDVYRLATRP
jgi:hypothetical protein